MSGQKLERLSEKTRDNYQKNKNKNKKINAYKPVQRQPE